VATPSTFQREATLKAVDRELQRVDARFGSQAHKGPGEWLAILAEEFGEAARHVCEMLHGDDSNETATKLVDELVQTAAMAVLFIEYGDMNGWWSKRDAA
jgi:hypothetical protein